MLEILSYEFMQRALIMGFIIGIATSLIGVFLVLKRLSLLGDSFAHASFGGIALGFVLNWNPLLTALGFITLASLGIDKLINKLKLYSESAIAIVLSFGMAFALILISLSDQMNQNIFSYLFGSILTSNNTDIILGLIILICIIIFYTLYYKKLIYSAFNNEIAIVRNKNTKIIDKIFIILAGLTIVISIRAVGILLISALLVIPAITGLRLAKSFKQTFIISAIVSVVGIYIGIFFAYYFEIPTGGSIVMSLIVLYLFSLIIKRN